jgi:hypothetical protein
MPNPAPYRLVAAALSAAAIFTLALQTYVDTAVKEFSFLGSLIDQYLYFTNISVLLVALLCGLFALRGWTGPSLPAGLTLWMALVGVIYHALLAADHNPEGLDVVVNLFQHTVLPIGVALMWLALAPKEGLSARDPFLWAIYPILYAVYGLAVGTLGGKYPYFFLNPVKTGWGGVGLYIIGIAALFLAGGFAIYALARRLNRR